MLYNIWTGAKDTGLHKHTGTSVAKYGVVVGVIMIQRVSGLSLLLDGAGLTHIEETCPLFVCIQLSGAIVITI